MSRSADIVRWSVIVVLVVMLGATTHVYGATSFDDAMQPVLSRYLMIQKSLAADSIAGISKAAHAIMTVVPDLQKAETSGEHAEQYRELPPKIERAAKQLAAAGNLDSAREAFRELSMPVAAWAVLSKPEGVVVAFCPMVSGSWVQPAGAIRNPYFGKRRLECGHIVGDDFHGCPQGGCKQGCEKPGSCPHEQGGSKRGCGGGECQGT